LLVLAGGRAANDRKSVYLPGAAPTIDAQGARVHCGSMTLSRETFLAILPAILRDVKV
jgi:hypothetical protein